MKNQYLFLSLLFFSFLLLSACKKNDDSTDNENITGSAYPYQTNVTGRILDENNKPLSDVTITSNGKTTLSDHNGIFLFKNLGIKKERCIVRLSKSGYFLRAHAFAPTINSVNYLKIVLIKNTQIQSLSSTTGGTITLFDQSSVQFPPNAFMMSNGTAYNGMVNIVLKHLSPQDVNFGFSIPGGDLLGKDATGNEVALYSYGMLGVQLTGSGGEALQLASGSTAVISTTIASVQLTSAPATLPLWYFDESTALWKEEGTVNKTGNKYVGTVSHFSWWNCDYPGQRAAIKGKVLDCKGYPLPNVIVTVDGWYDILTDQNGMYSDWVPAGLTFTVQLLAINNPGLFDSQLENIPALTSNQIYSVPDLAIICPSTITGALKSCTGEFTDGLVLINDGGGFFTYQFTNDGKFRNGVISGHQLFLNAGNDDATGQLLVPGIPVQDTFDVGDIVLCQTNAPIYENGFVVNGNGNNNKLFIIDTTIVIQHSGGDSIDCIVFGTDLMTGINCFLQVKVHGSGVGTYNYSSGTNDLNIDIDGSVGGIVQYQSYYLNSNGTIEITHYDHVGGKVKANFSGVLGDGNGGLIYITNGRLTVPRM